MMKYVDKMLTILFGMDRSVILLFIFSILGSVVNYAFQIVLGNMLTVSDYGDFNTINSLSSNLMCLYSPLAVYTCRISAEKQNDLLANSRNYERILIFVVFVSFFIIILGGGLFLLVPGAGFGVETFSLWMLILVMTVIAGGYTVLNGTLQGIGQLGWYGFLGFFWVVMKMGLSYVGVRHGGRVPAVVWAMLVSYIVVMCIIIVVISRAIKYQHKDRRKQVKSVTGYMDILQLYGITFLVQMFISLYFNGGEIILMSYFYDSTSVGLYSLASNVAKVGMYVLSIFTSALLPNISSDWVRGKSIKRKFYVVVVLALGIGFVWFWFLSTVGRQLILLLLGERYYEALSSVKYMALWIIGLGMLIVINTFYLAINMLKRYMIVLIAVTGCIMGVVAICGMQITYVPIVIGVGIQVIVLFAFVDINRLTNPNNTEGCVEL